MSRPLRWQVSPGAVLLLALVWFFDSTGLLAALAPAVLVHELGHALALRRCGGRLTRVSLGVFGVEMDYAGVLGWGGTLLSLAAGPAAGLLYGLAALRVGGDYLWRSGTVSLLLTGFNLLPILPLDGGRLVAELTDPTAALLLSRIAAGAFFLSGLGFLLAYRVPWPALVGLWLLSSNFR